MMSEDARDGLLARIDDLESDIESADEQIDDLQDTLAELRSLCVEAAVVLRNQCRRHEAGIGADVAALTAVADKLVAVGNA